VLTGQKGPCAVEIRESGSERSPENYNAVMKVADSHFVKGFLLCLFIPAVQMHGTYLFSNPLPFTATYFQAAGTTKVVH
jgi:hypothetical protein